MKQRPNKKRRLFLLVAIAIALIPFIYGATISGWHQLVYGGDFSLNASSLNFYTFNQSRLFISNAGLVGIGTTSPSNKLDVVGPASEFNFSGTEPLGFLVRGSTGSGTDLSGIDFAGAGYAIPLARIAVNSTGSGTFLSLGTSNEYVRGITNKALTIDPSGNIGIGTTYPDHDLEIGTGTYSEIDAGEATFTTGSSREYKENFEDINSSQILEKFRTLPLKRYQLKKEAVMGLLTAENGSVDKSKDAKKAKKEADDAFEILSGEEKERITQITSKKRIGPVAEDFYAAFGLGEPDKISGDHLIAVAMLSTQALAKEIDKLKAGDPSSIFFINSSTGKVGIGDDTPEETLDIVGNLSTTQTNNTLGNIHLIEYNSSCAGFRFGTNGGMVLSCN